MTVSMFRTMHPQSPPLTIGGTVLKKSDNLVRRVEKHLRSVSRAASQRLCILRKSWGVFLDRSLLGRCSRDFVLSVFVYCSAVWCSAADTHLKLLDRPVRDAWFLTGGVFECDIAHRRSVAVLCMLYKIRCNPMHPLTAALNRPYVPVRGYTRCAGHTSVYLCAVSLQNLAVPHDFYSHLSVLLGSSCWPRIRRCGSGGIQEQGQCFFIVLRCSFPTILFYYFSLPVLSVHRLVMCGWGLRTDRAYITLSQLCTADLF